MTPLRNTEVARSRSTEGTAAGALAGIGFTMSIFIAGQAFPVSGDFAVARIAVFTASKPSSLIGVALLWDAPPHNVWRHAE